jgi:GxxExxY protein
MNTDEEDAALNALTERIIGCCHVVHNKFGCGFLEKIYKNSVCLELQADGLSVVTERPIDVLYRGVVVGQYFADLIVEGRVIIELKAVKSLDEMHSAQCINYLAATGIELCLLINFGRRVEVKRFRGPRRKPS